MRNSNINKNFGLDFIRMSAITLVLIHHSVMFTDKYLAESYFPFGFFGVELFFVLSGFLIGQIIIKDVFQTLKFKDIVNFWLRRWFRTLPLYYLVLIIRDIFFDDSSKIHTIYYFFAQNFYLRENHVWFGESWSLAVEEWFYLFIPLILFIILKIFKSKKTSSIIGVLILLIFILFIIRTYYVITNGSLEYNLEFRMLIPIRLDALMTGVLLAAVKVYYKKFYEKLTSLYVLIISLVSIFILLFIFDNILVYNYRDAKLVPSTIGFSITSFLLVLTIPFFERNKSFESLSNNRPINFIVRRMSLYTYSIYLIHELLFIRIISFKPYTLFWVFQVLVAMVCTVIFSAILYKYYEKPMMNLRDKIKV